MHDLSIPWRDPTHTHAYLTIIHVAGVTTSCPVPFQQQNAFCSTSLFKFSGVSLTFNLHSKAAAHFFFIFQGSFRLPIENQTDVFILENMLGMHILFDELMSRWLTDRLDDYKVFHLHCFQVRLGSSSHRGVGVLAVFFWRVGMLPFKCCTTVVELIMTDLMSDCFVYIYTVMSRDMTKAIFFSVS